MRCDSYFKARVIPIAILRRRPQDKGMYASECKAWARERFLAYSYTSICCPCSTQYPWSVMMFGCLKRDVFQITSKNCCSSWSESEIVLIHFTANTFKKTKTKKYHNYLYTFKLSSIKDVYLSIRKLCSEHGPERSFTKKISSVEVICG